MDYPHEMDPSLSEDFLYYFDNPPIHTEQPRPSHQSMSSYVVIFLAESESD